MKILLVKPPTGDVYKKFRGVTPEYPPLGLAYVAAVLEQKNHDVKIVDMAIEKTNIHDFLEIVEGFNPNVIGLTATTPTVNNAYEIVRVLKKSFECRIIMGGPHVTALPDEAIQMGSDAVIIGEAEITIFEALKKDGIFGPSYVQNLDMLPFPARHLLPMGKYRYFFAKRKPLTNMISSRGCPYNCVFCNKEVAGYKFRARGPKNIVDELEHLINEFGIREVHISDDAFTLNEKRVIEVCNEIIKRKLDLTFYPHNGIRVDTVTEPLLKAMKRAGFYSIPFGFESGNQEVLNKSRKSFTLDQARKAVKLSKKYGFEIWGFFIFGLLGDTERTMQETIDFAKELDVDVAKFHVLVPLPGSYIYQKLKAENRILVKKWSEFCFYDRAVFNHPTCDFKMNMFLSRAYKQFYLRPSFILKASFNVLKSPRRFFDIVNVFSGIFK